MTVTSNPSFSLRREDLSRLLLALVLSLVFHGLVVGVWQLNQRYHFLEYLQPPAWMFPPKRLAERIVKPPPTAEPDAPPVLEILPSVYVDVNPAAITQEPPKDTPYYSTANTAAANRTAEKETNVPKIEGAQTLIPRTETVTRPSPQPLIPAPPVAAPMSPPPVVAQPKVEPAPPKVETPTRPTPPIEAVKNTTVTTPGDLALVRPAEREPAPTAPSRPRSFKEAVNRLAARDPAAAAGLVGEQMKQDGGVRRQNVVPSHDVRASPFGAYDQAIIYAVQNRWYALLDSKGFAGEAVGKLSLRFRLHQDGRVTDLRVTDQSVDEIYSIICQRAVLDNAPYAKWPPDMRRMIQEDYRDVTFTFYYH
jgi:hypothetical protein